jgi:hypothetical protein
LTHTVFFAQNCHTQLFNTSTISVANLDDPKAFAGFQWLGARCFLVADLGAMVED